MIDRKDFTLLSNVLKPREVVMFLHFKIMADWDEKHVNYNTARKTIREIQVERLPSWSIGKICESRKILMDKGLLAHVDRTRVRLSEEKVLHPELIVPVIEPTVPIAEPAVQEAGQSRVEEIKKQISEMTKKFGKF